MKNLFPHIFMKFNLDSTVRSRDISAFYYNREDDFFGRMTCWLLVSKPVILLRKQSALIKKNIKLSPLSTGESKPNEIYEEFISSYFYEI